MTRKLVATAFGAPREVLTVIDVPRPSDGDVIVDVKAAGLNPFDVKSVKGVMGTDPARLPLTIGNEGAGVVREAAADTGFVAGDRVVVYPASGTFAQTVAVPAGSAHRLPDGVGFDEAAGLLLAGATAFDLVETLDIGADDTVLVHGGAGAVGSIVVVLAVGRGATAIASASPRNHDAVRALGARPVSYGEGFLYAVREAASSPVTAAIDTVGSDEAIDVSLALVGADRVASIAAWGRVDDGITVLNGSSEASKKHRRDAVEPLLAALADGRVTVEIAGTSTLDDAADAFEALAGDHPRGKYILHP
ncbi:putative oxidoreductase [Gordonia spumicola]|uniref:Putative oxidoreductase n=1 Tax=Gordonia spumicola TaxID=589161 RepID=A0A7I9VF94_9ACTN|nr:NADP-dependent oxidoreductase [Gordonia spumicola]GEE03975.1 putative oxidoreductase [Gordonia spumicola]